MNDCICSSTSIEVAGNLLCCHYYCKTCSGPNSSDCETCDSVNKHRTKIITSCECEDGYYQNGSNPICGKCHEKCFLCETSDTNCKDCDAFNLHRVLFNN